MSIMWTAASFTFYCLSFSNKYLEGNIFVNYYLEGVAGIIGALIAQPIYSCIGIRWSFVTSYCITLLFLTLLLIFQEQYVSSHWIVSLGSPPSPYPENSKEDNDFNLRTLVPVLVFLLKVSNSVVYLNVY